MIKLDENYSIKTDPYNFVLFYLKEEEYKDEDGETKIRTSKDKWFFPTLRNCLDKYFNESLKPAENVQDLWNRIEIAEFNIAEALGSKCNAKCKC